MEGAPTVTPSLSPIRCMILNAAWAAGFLGFVVFFLARDGDLGSHNIPILYVLMFLGPLASAALCDRLLGPVFGAMGFGVGILIFAVICTIAGKSANVDWGRAILIPLVSLAHLTVTIPVWWLFHRRRRTAAAMRSF